MTRRQYIGITAGILWSAHRGLATLKDDFVVIAHPSNRFDLLSRSKLSYLFLRKVSRWPWGAEVAPTDLASNRPIRRRFVEEVLQMTEEQLAEYWIDQRATRGVSPPGEVRDDAAVKLWVASRPGGIGYISGSALDSTVKAIRVAP